MLGFDNTKSIRDNAKYINLATPAGNERQLFKVGEEHTCSPVGLYKAGVKFTIVEAYPQNGFWHYMDNNGVVHRTKDILEQ